MKNLKKLGILFLIILLFIIFFIKFNIIYISVFSESMSPTLNIDDKVISINKNLTNINTGDIIVFESNDEVNNGGLLIKRVVAKENDYVKIKDNKLFVNNQFIKNIGDINSDNLDLLIDENEFFVLGDNVNNSYDSRNYGPILYSQILSKAVYIIKK